MRAASGGPRETEGAEMVWEILAWAAVVVLYAFRIALVVGILAVVVMVVRTLARAQGACPARRRAGSQIAHTKTAPVPGAGSGLLHARVSAL